MNIRTPAHAGRHAIKHTAGAGGGGGSSMPTESSPTHTKRALRPFYLRTTEPNQGTHFSTCRKKAFLHKSMLSCPPPHLDSGKNIGTGLNGGGASGHVSRKVNHALANETIPDTLTAMRTNHKWSIYVWNPCPLLPLTPTQRPQRTEESNTPLVPI